jgi:two-component system, cell cycle response regulator DivK
MRAGGRRPRERKGAPQADQHGGPKADGSGPLVLIVDDFEDNRAMYVQFLTFEGFRVAEAENGAEALEQARNLHPDLIVMDLSLPVMDGWEATRRLKSDARTRRIPVLALTGHALGGHSQRAKEAGCDAYLTKPCLPEDLVVEIRKMIGGTSTTRVKAKGGRGRRG